MSLDRTAGFDILVQISETEINTQLATAFLAGTIIPSSLSTPFSSGGITGRADFNFSTPIADLDRPRPNIGLTIPFTNSQLVITAPLPLTLSPLAGNIVIVDRVQVITEGTNQIVTIDFNDGAPTVTVTYDAASQAVLAPALAAAGLTQAQFDNMSANQIMTQLQTSVGRIDLSTPIAVTDDTDPATVFDIAVTTINDTSSADRDCLVMGLKMASDSGGNISLATTNLITPGSESVVMFSNFWLLARVMRPKVAAALGIAVSALDTPLRLNRNVPAPGGEGTLTALEARVVGNRIQVDGTATDSGTGWSAVSNFTFFIDLALSGGAITITSTTPTVDTDIDEEWWVWLVSFAVMPILGPIIVAIVDAIAEGIVNDMISSGISGSFGSIPSIPLGPIGGGVSISSVVLDDFELRGSIMRSVTVPVKNQGSHSSITGFALDLDNGNIRTAAISKSDLIWDPARGLFANSSVGLTVTGRNYYSLSPVEISRMPLSNTMIPLSSIPLAFPTGIPFFTHPEVVFGVRTTDGRYGKVRAWRNLFSAGELDLDWVTYDTPTPQLDIADRWSVYERGEVTEYITSDCNYCKSSQVRWRGVFEAWPRLMAFPIDYQWCLCGTVIAEGEGEVNSKYGPIAYKLTNRQLTVTSDLGQTIDCELCVSAIDARGHELFTCIKIFKPGTDINCHKCVPTNKRIRTDYIPISNHLKEWRPLELEFIKK